MSTLTLPPPRSGPPAFEPYRISVGRYLAMGEAGLLTPDDRVELLDGVISEKPMRGRRHVYAVKTLCRMAEAVLSGEAHAQKEDPVVLTDSVPEPDVSVVRGTPDDYLEALPTAGDCLLVVEVSDTTLPRDLDKAALYAEAGVPAYWIVDVNGRRVIAHRGPTPGGYADVSDGGGASIDLPGGRLTVSADDLLGDV